MRRLAAPEHVHRGAEAPHLRSHRKLELPIVLDDACRGVPCGATRRAWRARASTRSVTDPDDPDCLEDPRACPRDGGAADASVDARDGGGGGDASMNTIVRIAAGGNSTCAELASGTVQCWAHGSAT